MADTNYKICALDILLNKDCLSERYYPLIDHKDTLIKWLITKGCTRKDDIKTVSDEELKEILTQDGTVRLFRRFLTLYDANPSKMRELNKLELNEDEMKAYRELFLLPGVKAVRACLYCKAGYGSLDDFAGSTIEEVLLRTAEAIEKYGMSCIVPLKKEIRTHIAVAKAFLL